MEHLVWHYLVTFAASTNLFSSHCLYLFLLKTQENQRLFFIEHCTWTCKFVPDQVRKRTFFQNIWCIFKVWPDKKYAPSKIWFTYNFKFVEYSLDLNFVCICNIISYAYVCRPFKISENVNLRFLLSNT